jgi:hypothetical protein
MITPQREAVEVGAVEGGAVLVFHSWDFPILISRDPKKIHSRFPGKSVWDSRE